MRATLAAILFLASAAAVAADAGEIKVVNGSAYLERAGERLALKAGMPVREADVVVTGANGTVGITFADNSLLSIGPNSNFTIERFGNFPPTKSASSNRTDRGSSPICDVMPTRTKS